MISDYIERLPPDAVQMVRAALASLEEDAREARQHIAKVHDHLAQTGMDAHAATLKRGLSRVVSMHEQLEGLQMMLSISDVGGEPDTTQAGTA